MDRLSKFRSGLKKRIKNLDMYGHEIQLNFDDTNGGRHKTLVGGSFSLIIQMGLLAYIVIVFVRMFTFADDKNSSVQTLFGFQSEGEGEG